MKVLVTGGAGYIGSHVVDLLIRRGHEVVVFDNLSTGHREAVHKDAVFVKGDLLDWNDMDDLFSDHSHFDAVIHLASYTLVGESMDKPMKYLQGNVNMAAKLLRYVVDEKIPKFILSSTANVYGNRTEVIFNEVNPTKPSSPYGESKAYIERMLHWMHDIYDIRYTVFRYFNATGAHPDGHLGEDHDPETHLIPNIMRTALGQQEKLVIHGVGHNLIRDFVHVCDLAEAHVIAVENHMTASTYNLGSGVGFSLSHILSLAEKIIGHAIPVEHGSPRPGDPGYLIADIKKVQQALDWHPQYGIQDILQSAWDWHRTHPHGYAVSLTGEEK